MSWFKKNDLVTSTTTVAGQGAMDTAHTVEIIAHKDATQKVVNQAKEANSALQKLFVENGFTVKIVLAMGAKTKRGG